jgi:hypothetical protein
MCDMPASYTAALATALCAHRLHISDIESGMFSGGFPATRGGRDRVVSRGSWHLNGPEPMSTIHPASVAVTSNSSMMRLSSLGTMCFTAIS